MKRLTATIKLHFSDEGDGCEVETNNVPLTMVMEGVSNLAKGLATKIVEDAAEVIPESEQENYLDSRIELDRKLLADLIAKAPVTNIQERAETISLLERYSKFLEQQGYLDTDWRTEAPFAIDEFLKQKP